MKQQRLVRILAETRAGIADPWVSRRTPVALAELWQQMSHLPAWRLSGLGAQPQTVQTTRLVDKRTFSEAFVRGLMSQVRERGKSGASRGYRGSWDDFNPLLWPASSGPLQHPTASLHQTDPLEAAPVAADSDLCQEALRASSNGPSCALPKRRRCQFSWSRLLRDA